MSAVRLYGLEVWLDLIAGKLLNLSKSLFSYLWKEQKNAPPVCVPLFRRWWMERVKHSERHMWLYYYCFFRGNLYNPVNLAPFILISLQEYVFESWPQKLKDKHFDFPFPFLPYHLRLHLLWKTHFYESFNLSTGL